MDEGNIESRGADDSGGGGGGGSWGRRDSRGLTGGGSSNDESDEFDEGVWHTLVLRLFAEVKMN